MKKIYIYKIVAAIGLIPLLFGCECPCNEAFNPFACTPREVTITEFDAGIIEPPEYVIRDGDTVGVIYYPVDTYSIHAYQFPINRSNSGSLPLDESSYNARQGVDSTVIASIPLANYDIDLPYMYAMVDAFPTNNKMVGDVIIEDIDLTSNPTDPSAFIRVAGRILRISPAYAPPYMSESSRMFCEYMDDNLLIDGELNTDLVNEFRENMVEFGEGIPGSTRRDFTVANGYAPVVVNAYGRIVVDQNGNINPNIYPPDENLAANLAAIIDKRPDAMGDLGRVIEEKELRAITIEAHIGDVFFYRATNGRDFIFAIINIDERDVGAALKRRVSIMFNEI
ncbi:MAG: hypothetical protein ACLFQX_06155 [Candidatus Kapaibacterium sp.]